MSRTAQQVVDDWASRMQASQQKMSDGIQGVTESPMEKAAANLDKYKANTAAAVDSGKMARRLRATSLNDWKTAALAKVSRVGSGAMAAKAKFLKHMANWLPFVASVKAQVRAMPSTTPTDRDARMMANAALLRQYKGPGA